MLLSLNARSIVSKIEELEVLLLQYDPCVVVVTETWLTPDIKDAELLPQVIKCTEMIDSEEAEVSVLL